MNMTLEDSRLLAELCEQHGVSADKVLKLLDALREILKCAKEVSNLHE